MGICLLVKGLYAGVFKGILSGFCFWVPRVCVFSMSILRSSSRGLLGKEARYSSGCLFVALYGFIVLKMWVEIDLGWCWVASGV